LHRVRFKKGEGKELEKSNKIVLESENSKTDPREVCYPGSDFPRFNLKEVNRGDGVVFESKELDYIFRFTK
jgi:hypothetical protein